jgi:tRNA nucleotidyltransferase/poly(A) polymerase
MMNLPIDTNIFPRKKGVFIVGGSIRDLLGGRPPIDFDLAVANDTAGFAGSLADRIAGHVVEFGKHGHTILRVVSRTHYYDIMPLNGKSIEEDLHRRDFTINAIALDISTGNLIDPTGGRQDLAAKKVRMVAGDVFRKDPVRLVRAYRMAASFDLTIEKDTRAAIFRDTDLIRESAGERIRDEIFKILKTPGSCSHLTDMAKSGLLFSIIPELSTLKNCRLEEHRPQDLFNRTLDAYRHLERLPECRNLPFSAYIRQFSENDDASRLALLKWSVLLHNIGRPVVRTTRADGKSHFYGHAARSAGMARDICRRLRLSRQQTDDAEFVIRHHLHPFFLYRARQKRVSDDRPFIRFFMRCDSRTPDVLLHALVAFSGHGNPQNPSIHQFSEFIGACMDRYYSVLRPRSFRPLPLGGNDLINEFGLKPSAAFKPILRVLKEEHLARERFTREEALEMVEKLLNKKDLTSNIER